MVVAGLTQLVGNSEAVATTYQNSWPKAVTVLAEVTNTIKAKPVVDEPAAVDLHDAEIDEVSFGATFSRLNTCKKRTVDPVPDVGNPLEYVAGKLREADTRTGVRIQTWAKGELGKAAQLSQAGDASASAHQSLGEAACEWLGVPPTVG